MIKKSLLFSISVMVLSIVSLMSVGHAATINFSLDFDYEDGTASPYYGFGPGYYDNFATLTYDETLLTNSGFEYLTPEDDPTFAFTITLGSLTLDETDDIDYPTFPEAEFYDGHITFFDFYAEWFAGDLFFKLDFSGDEYISFFQADTSVTEPEVSDFYYLEGYAEPVPEPATILLLGLGLLGVASVFRKQGREHRN